MSPAISIIVPVYNNEKYLGKCLHSIINQTFKDLEILLIDDGSTDHSGQICDEFASKDNRIKVIHQINKGVSAARNAGLALAKSEFIGFVDCDDWIEPDMFYKLHNLIVQNNASISICGYSIETREGKRIESNEQSGCLVLTPIEALEEVFKRYGFQGYLVNKLFRSTFFSKDGSNIRLDIELSICEDLLCTCQCIDNSKKIVYDGTILYHYIRHTESACGKFSMRLLTLITAKEKIMKIILGKYPSLVEQRKNDYVLTNIYLMDELYHNNQLTKFYRKMLRNNMKIYFKDFLLSQKVPIVQKMSTIFIACHPAMAFELHAALSKFKAKLIRQFTK